jgi:hypothetical protein
MSAHHPHRQRPGYHEHCESREVGYRELAHRSHMFAGAHLNRASSRPVNQPEATGDSRAVLRLCASPEELVE